MKTLDVAVLLGDTRLGWWRWCPRKPPVRHCDRCGAPAILWRDPEQKRWLELGVHVVACT
jgi:hypothetical protein